MTVDLKYTATIYGGDEILATNSSDDIEMLYLWMLTNDQCLYGDVHGQIIDNIDHEVVREFKKRSME